MQKTLLPARRRLSLALTAIIAATLFTPLAGHSATIASHAPAKVAMNLAHDVSVPLSTIKVPHVKSHGPSWAYLHNENEFRPVNKGKYIPSKNTTAKNLKNLIKTPSVTFEGMGDQPDCLCAPPDNEVAASPTQVIEFINTDLQVYNKTGAALSPVIPMTSFFNGFPGARCNGSSKYSDPIVLWDTLASRWMVQILDTTNFATCWAVSTTSSGTGTWNRYAWADPHGGNLPDYPKVGVWPDAYYLTVDEFNTNGVGFLGPSFCAVDRAKMIAGLAAKEVCLTYGQAGLSNTYFGILPGSLDGPTAPPAGAPEWFVTQSPTLDANSFNAALTYCTMKVDWAPATPTATLSTPIDVGVAEYTPACLIAPQELCVVQPAGGETLDGLGKYLMYRLAYRNFGDHQAMVVGIAVDSGDPNTDPETQVGMNWYELRPNGSSLGSTLSLFQQGTHAPTADFRWAGSVAMDKNGDIGLGYSLSGATIDPSIAYTGRLVSDPLGQMTMAEGFIQNGAGDQLGATGRWGDYSELSIDPADDCTFWYSNEYYNGVFADWQTRIGSFKFPSCTATTTNDFSIGASPSSVSMSPGGSANTTVSTTITSGSGQTVNLSASGLPSGVSASFTPSTITSGQSSVLTLSASSSAALGTSSVNVTGTGSSVTKTTAVSVTVLSANDFSIGTTPTSVTVAPGNSGNVTVNTAVVNGSAETVNLSATGLPSGVSAAFGSSSLSAGGSTTLTLSAAPSAAPGTNGITVTGVSPSASHSTIVNLTVSAPPPDTAFTPNLSLFPNSLNSAFLVQKDAEPTMSAAEDGSIYINSPIGGGGGCHAWSVDKKGPTPTYLGQSDAGYGGADCDVATSLSKDPTINPDKDIVAASSLGAQGAQIHTSLSPDAGQTWVTNPNGVQTAADDRMWMSPGQADKPDEFFMTYRQAPGTGFLIVTKSEDGGLTYATTGPPINNVGTLTSNFTSWEGNIVVDPRDSNNLYVIFEGSPVSNRVTATESQVIWLGSSHDGGVNWTETVIHDGGAGRSYGHIFPSIAMDQAGRLFATYTDGSDMYIASAPVPPAAPEGTWTEVTLPRGTLNGRPVVKDSFPWITASKPGQADIAWLGSNDATSNANSQWGLYFARSINGAAPSAVLQANSAPFHKGWVCEGGGGCTPAVGTDGVSTLGDRRMGDFLTIRDDKDGLAHIAFTHDPNCPCGGSGQPDGRGSYLQYVREVPKDLDHLSISPASSTITADGTQTYVVHAFNHLNDDTGDVTSSATFAITPNGSCTGPVCGSTTPGAHTVTAHVGSKTVTAALQITGGAVSTMTISPTSSTVAAGSPQAYTTTGTDAHGNSLGNITSSTTFGIDNGSCTANSCKSTLAGTRTVTATNGAAQATASLTVTPGPRATIILSPASTSVIVGDEITYTATGKDAYGNTTDDATPGTTFVITPDGSCTANKCKAAAVGNHTVTGTNGSSVATATLIGVTGTVDHLVLSPASSSQNAGVAETYTAEAFDAANTDMGNFTASAVFSITPNGSCTNNSCSANAAGTHTVKANVAGAIGTATLNVTPGPTASITLTPANASIPSGGSQVYVVRAADQYGNSNGDVTSSSILTIGPDGSCSTDRCTATLFGPHTVGAAFGAFTAQATLNVLPPAPVIVTPAANSSHAADVTVSGTASAGTTTVDVYEGVSKIATGVPVSATDGTWSRLITFGTGSHTLTAKAIQGGLASNPSASRTFTVDATAPKVKTSKPAGYVFFGIYLPTQQTSIKGTATDNSGVDHLTITYTNLVTGTVIATTHVACVGCPNASVSWHDEPPLGAGLWEASTVAYDKMGNASAPDLFDFVTLL